LAEGVRVTGKEPADNAADFPKEARHKSSVVAGDFVLQ
jgi:hypothetical protein